MDDISDKLKGILSDPEGMEKILGIAKTLQGSFVSKNTSDSPISEQNDLIIDETKSKKENKNQNDSLDFKTILSSNNAERTQLLKALRPFFKDEKKEKVDKIIRTIQALELLSYTNDLI